MNKYILTGGIVTALLSSNVVSAIQYKNEITKLDQEVNSLDVKDSKLTMSLNNEDGLINQYQVDIDTYESKVSKLNSENKKLKINNDKLKKKLDKEQNRRYPSKSSNKVIKTMTMELSFYTNDAREGGGLGAITKSGYDVSNTTKYQGMGIVASYNNQLPLYSIIEIEGLGKYIVLDSGKKIIQNKLDVLVSSRQEAFKRGRYDAKIKVLRLGEG